MRALGWNERRYWYARDSLLEEGVIARARGRGGAVRMVQLEEVGVADSVGEAELVGEAALASVREMELYSPIRETLQNYWAKERQIEPLAIEVTAARVPAYRRTGVPAAGGPDRTSLAPPCAPTATCPESTWRL